MYSLGVYIIPFMIIQNKYVLGWFFVLGSFLYRWNQDYGYWLGFLVLLVMIGKFD